MKKLLVLAGGSKRNQAWGEACTEFFKDQFDMTFFLHYDHWSTGEANLNFETEIEKISQTVKGAGLEGEWYVYAKSIGSILTLKAVAAGVVLPTKCVFFGMPFSVVADSVVKDELSVITSFSVSALALHNDNDPTALYEVTEKIITEYLPTVSLKTLEGDTHDYLDFSEYSPVIESFITE
jgi:hypothetical protein